MKSALAALLLIILHCLPHDVSAALFDKEIVFTEAEIQTAIDRNALRQKRVGTMLAVTLREAPKSAWASSRAASESPPGWKSP